MTELYIPRPGESINEVLLSKWFVNEGDIVEKDQEVGEIESDKATLPLIAPENGKISLKIALGSTINVGTLACTIDTSIKTSAKSAKNVALKKTEKSATIEQETLTIDNKSKADSVNIDTSMIKITPVARKLMEENNLSIDDILKGLKRLGKEEVQVAIESLKSGVTITSKSFIDKNTKMHSRETKREPMSQLRKKLSKRLVAVRNETAMLTTFNEVDMSQIIALRTNYQKKFTEKHGLKLGFMSFFTKAASVALQQFPKVNSQLENEDILIPTFVDIAIAVQTDKGLMVPVIKNTESMTLSEIENEIARLAEKAKSNRLSVEEMTGGTFTITNGGVFGSLLSTPILNPPQSAILGLHNIVERPVAINGKVEIRPMMYVALSYDHRIIDGRDSVSFLVRIKELLESPYKMLFNEISTENILLGL
jgi:2-oxoglutarate dehydrogenase E2 component (dihydrolipoamide succinyltransferase)